jgi:hypothetical protein
MNPSLRCFRGLIRELTVLTLVHFLYRSCEVVVVSDRGTIFVLKDFHQYFFRTTQSPSQSAIPTERGYPGSKLGWGVILRTVLMYSLQAVETSTDRAYMAKLPIGRAWWP